MSPGRDGRTSRVLVTGAGGPSGISVMRALADESIAIHAGDIDPYAAGLYLVPPECRALLPPGASDEFVDVLLELCRRERIDAVVPTVDSELVPLATRREEFARAGTTLVLAPLSTLELCLDKWALHNRCRRTVNVPGTVIVDELFEPAAVALPAIVKPRVGSGSRGIRLITSADELEPIERDGSLLVQDYLPGAEFSLDVLATVAGEVIAVVPRERLKVDSGIAITGRTSHDEGLEGFGREVAGIIGLAYVANVQVKGDRDGVPALLEVNPRFPGTMPLTVASGVNMPRLCVLDALGESMSSARLPFADLAMVRYFQERFLPVEEISELEQRAERSGRARTAP